METKQIYSEDNIKTLDTIAAIRLRPSMYIDGIGELGLFKIDSEGVQNIFDEALIGMCDKCYITYNTSTGYMKIQDNGRGIPIAKLEDIFTKAHTGGKFDRKAYEISAGQNGVGSKCINALSTWFKVDVYRIAYTKQDGTKVPAQHAWMEFKCGRKINSFIEDLPDSSTKHGTTLEYISDDSILTTNKRNIQRFIDYLNMNSYLIPGLDIEYTIDDKTMKFQHTGGISELLTDFIKSKKIRTILDPITVSGCEKDFSYDIIYTYSTSQSGDANILSAVNGNKTPMHGTHVTAFKMGCSMALSQFITETDAVPKGLKNITVSGSLVSDNIVGVVNVKHREPLYSGQTKEAFRSQEVIEPIKAAVRTTFLKWLHDNPNPAKRLVNMAIDYAKYEEEKKKLKKNMLETKQQKSAFAANGIDPSKYFTCRSKNPEEKELYIVEGQSAGGNANLMMNHEFQALYELTGKILNVAKASKNNLSKIILDLVQILGMGLPGQVNYKNLQFYKIIILTDADDDGAHIATLLLTFFFVFYPKIVEDGRIFIAQPPIKELILSNGNSFYLHTESDYNRLMTEFIVNSFDLYSEKSHKKLSENLFRLFISKCFGYDNLIDNHSNTLCIPCDLLELIVIYINDLIAGNYKEFVKAGYFPHRIKNTFTFDYGVAHTFLDMNDSFINGAYADIYSKLKDIYIYGIYLKGIRSKQEYHGTLYKLIKLMYTVLGNSVSIKRYKGLGEQSKESLSETCLDPKTRMMTKITMGDCVKAKKSVDIFMDDADQDFKRKFFAGEIDFE